MTDRPRMLFNAFSMAAVSHHAQGLWAEPDSRQLEYTDPQMWIDLARLLERGRFDALFNADVIAPYERYQGSRDATVHEGMQFPTLDFSTLIPLLAYHTEHLGFAYTQNILQEPPYAFARRMSTLDHLSGGRVAWNVVNSFLPGAGRNLGYGGLPDHDELYERAQDYLRAACKLWEWSWDDDAVVKNRVTRQFADPAKVHEIKHRGPYYAVDGPHLCEPSPQRTPLLFQAGQSAVGQKFAGRHAEAVFIGSQDPGNAASLVAGFRDAARTAGRDPGSIKVFVPRTYVVGSTEAEARRRDTELLERQTIEGNLARMSVFLDRDFAEDDPATPIGELRRRPNLPKELRALLDAGDRDDQTLGELILRIGNRRFPGTPEQIAADVAAWQEAGVDGINLQYVVLPTSFTQFVDHVCPVLQQHGLMQREYTDGTLRDKFFGAGPRLPDDHPARRCDG
ncbi:NtaA/DmoA family FMN-dependent monooxygenase [Amycolatopsis sp. lyj-112]|uniref:NtaA/DmoA family FMN-dependent monooxygenase n=1 Tax=Amycolatopsis sp. lyj-112 TaxID=2789288 RepID=UPI00397CB497